MMSCHKQQERPKHDPLDCHDHALKIAQWMGCIKFGNRASAPAVGCNMHCRFILAAGRSMLRRYSFGTTRFGKMAAHLRCLQDSWHSHCAENSIACSSFLNGRCVFFRGTNSTSVDFFLNEKRHRLKIMCSSMSGSLSSWDSTCTNSSNNWRFLSIHPSLMKLMKGE